MRIKRRRAIDAFVPTGSMADIAFLLIIFFMVTTKFELDRTRVDLPASSFRSEAPKGSAIVVIYEEGGSYGYKFSDGEDQSMAMPDMSALSAQVGATAALDPTKPFLIKAPDKAPYRLIDEAMDMMRRSGVENIVLLTEQSTVDDQGG